MHWAMFLVDWCHLILMSSTVFHFLKGRAKRISFLIFRHKYMRRICMLRNHRGASHWLLSCEMWPAYYFGRDRSPDVNQEKKLSTLEQIEYTASKAISNSGDNSYHSCISPAPIALLRILEWAWLLDLLLYISKAHWLDRPLHTPASSVYWTFYINRRYEDLLLR